MEIVSQISQWINDERGIFTFGTHTPMDESIFNSLSDFLLQQVDHYSIKSMVDDVSYLRSFALKDSVFSFKSSDIISGGDYQQDKRIIQTISESCIENNNVVLLQVPVYQTSDMSFVMKGGGSSIMYSSGFACVLSNGKLSVKKLRWDSSDKYQDLDILQFLRDYKLNLLL
jgi:hypothetical protein